MPDQRYEAQRQAIGTILSTTSPHIVVPDWQRSYSWGADEIEAFWQDLLAFDGAYPGKNITNEEYFLGSAVLVTGDPANLLLDGQQRLATATILLSVLRDLRRSFKADAATRLQNKYVADLDDATGQTTPVLTLNVFDRQYFRTEVQDERAGTEPRPTPTLKSHGLIRRARDYFADQVRSQEQKAGGGEAGFNRNLRLGDVLLKHMSLVAVSSSDEDNAAAVFETLNDRGIGLSTPDLLRNLLLRRAPGDDERSRVVEAWQAILEVAEEASVDDFLRHWWVSKLGDVKSRKLYREIKSAIEAQNIDSVEFSLELAESAPIYRDIARGKDSDADLQRVLEGIRMLGAKVLYPALLSGYAASEGGSKEALSSLASALTTLFVRHTVIGGRESTTLEATIYSVAAELRKTKNFDAAIVALESFAPTGADFVSRFKRASVSRIATARYILREIEHTKRATQEMSVELSDRVHVEHIYPQTPPKPDRWANHSQAINRLGNFTLLGKRLNTSIKNADFATKKEKGYTGSDILMTQELLEYDAWDMKSIDQRQDDLSKFAFEAWHFPDEVEPESEKIAEETDIKLGGDLIDVQTLDELPEVP